MAGSGGDGSSGGRPPGGEPEPAELWITGEQGGPGVPGGQGAPGGPGGPAGPGGPPGGHPPVGAGGGDGGRRARWIALTIGFVVLVAVIAVQHFAGGRPVASPDPTTSSSAPTPSSTARSSTAPSSTARSSTAESGTTASGTAAPQIETRPHRPRPTDVTEWASAPGENGDVGPTTSHSHPAVNTTSPRTSTVAKASLPGAGKWELVGYGPAGLIRYRPATGALTVTPVPPIRSGNILSFVVTRTAAIIRSMDNVPGYLVPEGKPAVPLPGLLGKPARVLPGPDADHLWLTSSNNPANGAPPRTSLVLVNAHGRATGTTIRVPTGLGDGGGYAVTSDGAGYALAYGIGGVYDVRPDGAHLVTHGQVVAAGPTAFLVYDCNDKGQCSSAVINRKTGAKRALAALTFDAVQTFGPQGVISADGRYAAVRRFDADGTRLQLVDLRTGRSHMLTLNMATVGNVNDLTSGLAFSPSGRYLLVAGTVRATPVDTRTGHLLDPLPIPPMNAMAIRPAT